MIGERYEHVCSPYDLHDVINDDVAPQSITMTNKEDIQPGWATAADVAARAGVSRSAVSRTFTPGASVSRATRERVLKAAEELGYQVNRLASSVTRRQSTLVGVVIPGMQNAFVVQLLGPIMRHLAHYSLAPLLMDVGDPSQMEDSLRYLLQYRVAGVLFTSGSPPIELAREYLRLQVPVVMINRGSNLEGVDVVSSDNHLGGVLAGRCLIETGARRLAYVNLPSGTYSGGLRAAGFGEAAATSGQSAVSLEFLQGKLSGYDGGADIAVQLLDRPSNLRPEGVFCANDTLAFGFMDTARHAFGLRIPEDIIVIGFDDIPMASATSFRLTTVRQDVEGLAYEAVDRLVERMSDHSRPARAQTLPVELVMRQTTSR